MKDLVSDTLKNILSDEDIKQYNELLEVKSDLMTIIGIKNLINFISDVIEETSGISFRSQVAKDYIDLREPIFKLKMDDLKIDTSKIEDLDYLDNITNNVTDFINKNIISRVSEFLSENIENNPDLKESFNKLSEEVRNITFINTYSIRISPLDNLIYLKYIL